MQKALKYLSFGTLAVLILTMMAATVLHYDVYYNPVFIALWGVVAVSGLTYVVIRGVPRKLPVFGLHLAFVLILAGALITHIWGESGMLHLRQGESESVFEDEDGTGKELPFSVSLERFEIVRYPGSAAPADYSSVVTVEGQKYTISMNHILRHRGYRFCQADFDEDLQGSILSVNHDPWGIGMTYTGYGLLLLSIILFFFVKDTEFRRIVKRLSATGLAVLALLVGGGSQASASEMPGDTPKVLPREVADAFGDLCVYYNDRICPLSTLSRDYCLKAYGKASWNDFNANQVLTGWLFYYDWWRVVPFKVKAKEKGTPKEAEKDFLQRSVAAGDALKLYPLAGDDGTVRWYNSNEMLPLNVLEDENKWTFVRKMMDVVAEAVESEDWPEVIRLVGKIKEYQEKTAQLPSQGKIKAEQLWCRLARPMVPFMGSITLGLLLFVLSGVYLSRKKPMPRLLGNLSAWAALALWIYLTLTIGLRWYVAGHGPFAGSYNVMMLMAWLSASAMLLLRKKFPLILPLGFILAGFTMLQAAMVSANPQITRLMPVLQSPLLSIHVLSMMISYTLLGLVALNGIMGLIVPGKEAKEKLRDVSLLVLYPAVFLITIGTFLGAVWANISWGNYWSWDPKETWALITLLVYSFALHSTSLKCFRNPVFFHVFAILAFICVLITYFGVNLLMGGMHAYA